MGSKPHQIAWYQRNREQILAARKERYAAMTAGVEYKAPKRVKAYQTKDEREAYMRRWREANPDTFVRLGAGVRLSGAAYNAMLAQQGGRCAICGDLPGCRRLAIDHEHAQPTVRGLLCFRCNTALGSFQDNPALLRAAAGYLERHQSRHLMEA